MLTIKQALSRLNARRSLSLAAGALILIAFQNCGKFDPATSAFSSSVGPASAGSPAVDGGTTVTTPAPAGPGQNPGPVQMTNPTAILSNTSAIHTTTDLETFLTSWDNLMVPRTFLKSGLVTSYDHAGSNMDYGNYLGTENGRGILFDQDGPGLVNKIWTAYTFQCGKLYFYFDGEASPSRTYTPQQIFDGNQVPFIKPLAANNYDSSGGNFSLVSIPFRKHLKITADLGGFCYSYYQVGFVQLGTGVLDRGFNDVENSPQASTWSQAGNGYPGSLGTSRTVSSGAFTLKANSTKQVLATGANATSVLKSMVLTASGVLNTPAGTPQTEAFENTWVHVSWDGSDTEAIVAPLPMLFGAGKSVGRVNALAYGLNNGRGYLDFPMPFSSRVLITLENRSSVDLPITNVEFQINDGAVTDPGLRLRGSYRSTSTVKNANTTFLKVSGGAGHVVSFVYEFGTRGTILEGDDTTIIDGTTMLHGTGTEDVFLGAWYFNQGDFTLPSNGAVNGAAYRSYVNDPVVFSSSVDFSMEHDNVNENSGDPVRGLVLWYGSAGTVDATPRN